MMVEVFGMMVEVSTLEEVCEAAMHEWLGMDKEDHEVYDDYEEFEDLFVHSYLYSEE